MIVSGRRRGRRPWRLGRHPWCLGTIAWAEQRTAKDRSSLRVGMLTLQQRKQGGSACVVASLSAGARRPTAEEEPASGVVQEDLTRRGGAKVRRFLTFRIAEDRHARDALGR